MPTRRTGFARSNRRANRRKLVWATKNVSLTQTAAGNVTNTDLLTDLKVAGASILGATIMRTHLVLSVSTTVAAGNDFYFALIVGESSDLVSNAASTALTLDPLTSPELDWMWWEHPVAAPVFDQGGTNIITRDIKSKRKIQELNQTYILSLKGGVAAGNVTTQVVTRTLLALP